MIYFGTARDKYRQIKISIQKPDDSILSHETKSVEIKKIEKRCQRITEDLNNGKSMGSPEILEKLRQMGQMVCDEILTPDIKEKLRTTTAKYLMLAIDEHLVHIPWELLCVDQEFLCQRFSMGRQVRTHQAVRHKGNRNMPGTLKMWILANPGNDLSAAESEGTDICRITDRMNSKERIVDAFLETEVMPDDIRERIKNYDIVHFAGHAEYHSQEPGQSGWKLANANFTAGDIDKITGGASMPALVFSNACQSARTGKWCWETNKQKGSFGLVNAFMLSGVRHYLGTFREIGDEPGSRFALEFYEQLISGRTVGQAVRDARGALRQDRSDTCWTSYILYGDPTFSYFGKTGTSAGITAGITNSLIKLEISVDGPVRGEKSGTSGAWRIPAICLAIIGFLSIAVILIPEFISTPKENSHKQSHQNLRLSIDQFIRLVENITALSFESSGEEKQALISQAVSKLKKIRACSDIFDPDEIPVDDWTSVRLPMAIFYDLKDDNEALTAFAIQEAIHEYPRIKLVDRNSLDKIKEEFRLSATDWVKSINKLNPDLWTARLFLIIEVINSRVLMQLEDTETGNIVEFFRETLETDKSPFDQKERLSGNLLKILKQRYPMQGRISEITDNKIILNIGEDVGVKIGQQFQVVDKNIILEVVSVKSNGTSAVKVVKGKIPLEKGWKAVAI